MVAGVGTSGRRDRQGDDREPRYGQTSQPSAVAHDHGQPSHLGGTGVVVVAKVPYLTTETDHATNPSLGPLLSTKLRNKRSREFLMFSDLQLPVNVHSRDARGCRVTKELNGLHGAMAPSLGSRTRVVVWTR
jgi:hypothetical protein